jgi:hypothetical protein
MVHGASPKTGNHVECYCRDCQAFAYYCGAEEAFLDAHGGSDLFQVKASAIEITQGADRLAAVDLTGGRLVRWYAGCCRTPLANTPKPRWLDLASLPVLTLGPDAARAAAVGPVICRAFTPSARGGEAAVGKPFGVGRLVRRVLGTALGSAFGAPWKRSPFRNAQTGGFIAEPHALDESERAALYARVDADRAATPAP